MQRRPIGEQWATDSGNRRQGPVQAHLPLDPSTGIKAREALVPASGQQPAGGRAEGRDPGVQIMLPDPVSGDVQDRDPAGIVGHRHPSAGQGRQGIGRAGRRRPPEKLSSAVEGIDGAAQRGHAELLPAVHRQRLAGGQVGVAVQPPGEGEGQGLAGLGRGAGRQRGSRRRARRGRGRGCRRWAGRRCRARRGRRGQAGPRRRHGGGFRRGRRAAGDGRACLRRGRGRRLRAGERRSGAAAKERPGQ